MSSHKKSPDPPLHLTRGEEEIMKILWDLGKGFVHDILERCPEPKPAYTTVSTIIRILEQKGFVGHRAYGRTHEYFPVVERNDYTRSYFRNFVRNYFSNSYHSLASFFTREENLSMKELEEINRVIQEEIERKKNRAS
jgi:predicted transcriptional regulator